MQSGLVTQRWNRPRVNMTVYTHRLSKWREIENLADGFNLIRETIGSLGYGIWFDRNHPRKFFPRQGGTLFQ